MRRHVPLLIDRLALYASRGEIAAAMVTDTREIKRAEAVFGWRGFPRPNPLFGGRYFVPAVVAFLDAYEQSRTATPDALPPEASQYLAQKRTLTPRSSSKGGAE